MADTTHFVEAPSSDDAHAAWDQIHWTTLVTLERGKPTPVTPGRHLGNDGSGAVYEARLGNTVVALKRIWSRGILKDHHRTEFEPLQKMAHKRHKHVIEAVGCYVLPIHPYTELGLLIWPVAQYDLGRLLSHMELAHDLYRRATAEYPERPLQPTTDEMDALEDLSVLVEWPWDLTDRILAFERASLVKALLGEVNSLLMTVFGCTAKALEYLHRDQQIRHKDVKPSQIACD